MTTEPLRVAILGSTGSVGRQAIDVIKAFPENLQLVALCAGSRFEPLAEQVNALNPSLVAIADSDEHKSLKSAIEDPSIRVEAGLDGIRAVASMPEADVVLASVVGQAGLDGVLTAIRAGKRVALANKESLVMAGGLVMSEARRYGASIIPVDSEHASLAQLIEALDRETLQRVILTASGGPFRQRSVHELEDIRPADALEHPNWDMGAKVTIDSATMMNKGFEVMEACWLFDLAPEKIGVLIHPESMIHAMVELLDGSLMAHMAPPDMRLPIGWALGYPTRLELPKRLDSYSRLFLDGGELSFQKADPDRWPALDMCRQALMIGGGTPAALAVADEVLVKAFLDGEISFAAITEILSQVLEKLPALEDHNLEEIYEAGAEGKRLATEIAAHHS